MKRHVIFLCAAIWCRTVAVGADDVRLKIEFDYDTALQFENVPVVVSVYNESDEMFELNGVRADSEATAEFMVLTSGSPIPCRRIAEGPVIGRLSVRPGAMERVRVDIADHYDLIDEGEYKISLAVAWHGRTFVSSERLLRVVSGVELTGTTHGAPGAEQEFRRYSLRYWVRNKQEHLFLRVDDGDEETNYGVVDLGPLIRVFDPVLKVDRDGTVTTLHQSGQTRYTRTVFRSVAKGMEFVDRSYHNRDGGPYSSQSGAGEAEE